MPEPRETTELMTIDGVIGLIASVQAITPAVKCSVTITFDGRVLKVEFLYPDSPKAQ